MLLDPRRPDPCGRGVWEAPRAGSDPEPEDDFVRHYMTGMFS